MAPYIAIGFVIIFTLIIAVISKNKKVTFLNFIISVANAILLFCQMEVFPYLFGHCNMCLLIGRDEGEYNGIDFSRSEKALGTPFDANDALRFLSMLILGIGILITIILNRKKVIDGKIRRIICNILTIIFLIIQFLFLQMAVYQ